MVKILLFHLPDPTFSVGSIPRELGRMTALDTLYTFQNEMTGEACTCGDASVIDLVVDNARVTAEFVHL